ncbi:MAG: alpha/beta fold hydrolase [Gammaproteobacteria bacterium]
MKPSINPSISRSRNADLLCGSVAVKPARASWLLPLSVSVSVLVFVASFVGAGRGMAEDLTAADQTEEVVVLLHGLGRGEASMRMLEQRLAVAGYTTYNIDYPSRKASPRTLVSILAAAVNECCGSAAKVHFVTHSLGGIIVRDYLAADPPDNVGRVVMLAPPNQGSELPDLLRDTWLFRTLMGPTALELGTDPSSWPNRLPMPTVETGVIAGTGSINLVGTMVIPGEDDGAVSVCSTWIEGLSDFLVVSATHTFIMRSTRVSSETIRFLQSGHFDHRDDDLTAEYLALCAEDEVASEMLPEMETEIAVGGEFEDAAAPAELPADRPAEWGERQ